MLIENPFPPAVFTLFHRWGKHSAPTQTFGNNTNRTTCVYALRQHKDWGKKEWALGWLLEPRCAP